MQNRIHLACRMTTQIFVAPSLFLLFLCVSVCTLLSTDLVNRVAPGTLGAGLNPIQTISNLILSKLGRFLVSMTLEVSSLLKKGAAKKAQRQPSLGLKEATCPIQCPTFKCSVCSLNQIQKKLSFVLRPLQSMKRLVLKLLIEDLFSLKLDFLGREMGLTSSSASESHSITLVVLLVELKDWMSLFVPTRHLCLRVIKYHNFLNGPTDQQRFTYIVVLSFLNFKLKLAFFSLLFALVEQPPYDPSLLNEIIQNLLDRIPITLVSLLGAKPFFKPKTKGEVKSLSSKGACLLIRQEFTPGNRFLY